MEPEKNRSETQSEQDWELRDQELDRSPGAVFGCFAPGATIGKVRTLLTT